MKVCAISDIHQTPLEMAIDMEFDILIFLGDYDGSDTIRKIMQIQERFNRDDERVIALPGNHEHAGLHEGRYIPIITFGPALSPKDYLSRFAEYRKELQSDPQVVNYLRKLIARPWFNIYLDEEEISCKTLALHGALAGDLGTHIYGDKLDPNGVEAKLWYRLKTEDDHRKNFKMMERLNLNVLIRGHDRNPQFASMDPQGKITLSTPKREEEYDLMPDKRQTITVGEYRNGHYVLIDTKVPGKTNPVAYFKLLPNIGNR
ncbi:MAG TPA: metallophosphoesterase [Candidatus Nanoarchaeia archaeon]|nr:metallophosphoesterase [Candidatus Nanoarchaeia archaeon]